MFVWVCEVDCKNLFDLFEWGDCVKFDGLFVFELMDVSGIYLFVWCGFELLVNGVLIVVFEDVL